MHFETLFERYKEPAFFGRYLPPEIMEPVLNKHNTNNQVRVIGKSVEGNPIYSYEIGKGKTKILIWSQMHGNESTTTKALFDFLNLLQNNDWLAVALLEKFTFLCLPMMNPDGAKVYKRENANGIDLNRDAQNLSQPESRILRKAFDDFMPDYCYNLHDQRTIFGVGETGKPATVSFLAPAYNEEREINETRARAMGVVAAMNGVLQQFIPGQIGRFDDTFNFNCVGDTFQFFNAPTILIEAGHFQGDYNREQTRKFIFVALLAGLQYIYENVIVSNEIEFYLNIPQNKSVFYDFVYKNVKINYDSIKLITNFAIQFKEELIRNEVCFKAFFSEIGNLDQYFGHFEYDARGAEYSDDYKNVPIIDLQADFYLTPYIKVVNGRMDDSHSPI